MAPNRRFRKSSGPSSNRPHSEKRRSFDRGEDKERRPGSDRRKDFGKKSWSGNRDRRQGDDAKGREDRGGAGKPAFDRGRGFEKKPWTGKREFRQGGDDRREPDRGGAGKPGFDRGRGIEKKTWTSNRDNPRRDDRRSRDERGGDDTRRFDREKKPGSSYRGKDFKGGERGQRPFYKQGFGRRREEGEQGDKPGRKSFVQSRMDRSKKAPAHRRHEEKPENPDGLIRLNKFISNSGVCSRREADNLITMGLITVNGKAITELGFKVKATDDVRYEGRKLTAEKMVYILLNKPKGYITTTDDPQERNTVMQILEGACKQRIYPVGRLDRNTSGLLLLTNDGELTDKLTHPSYNVKKIYKAELDKPLTKADFQKIREGVKLEEGTAMIDDIAVVSEDGKTIGLEIHIGWNRVIRRIFEVLGYDVVKLDRTVYASLDKKDLPRGHWRFLRQEEVVRLKHFQ